MWILADILIIAIVAFFVYSSVKRGFVKSIMGSAARIVSIILVFNLCTPFGAYLGESAIGDAVRVKIEEKIETASEKSEADDSDTIIKNLEVPGFMSAWMTEQSENAKLVAADKVILDSCVTNIIPDNVDIIKRYISNTSVLKT